MPTFTTSLAEFDHPVHAAAIVDLIREYASEPAGGEQSLQDQVSQRIVPGLQKVPGAFAILAWDGEVAVGVAVCFRGYSTFAAQQLVNVHDLAVRSDYRGQGVGTLLLQAVESEARSLDCCKVTLEVRVHNPRAEKLYRNLGFGDPDGFETRFLDKKL